MNAQENSVSDMRMLASDTLETLLNQVKSSNLNFTLQQSPFSAIVSIKSSFVKENLEYLCYLQHHPPQGKP